MRIFLSWSGVSSKTVAIAFRDFLKRVIQSCEPWVSERDIRAGRRWRGDLSEELKEAKFGIICLTKENLTAPWIQFEAGALAKMIDEANVCPYLLDVDFSELIGNPLAEFQGKKAGKEPTFEILETINSLLVSPLDREVLRETFGLILA